MDPYIAFDGDRRLAAGDLITVALAARSSAAAGGSPLVLNAEAQPVDLDLRGSEAEVRARLPDPVAPPPRKAGRPKLGVTAREVTLLPRHWDWLAEQPGGASAALRRLVDAARGADDGATAVRKARETAYRFISTMAGNRPGFEEAARALFAGDAVKFVAETGAWPADIRTHARKLATPGLVEGKTP